MHIDDPVSVNLDVNGVAATAEINLPKFNRCKRFLAPWDRIDGDADDAAEKAASSN